MALGLNPNHQILIPLILRRLVESLVSSVTLCKERIKQEMN